MNDWQIIVLISFVIVLPAIAAVVMQVGPFQTGALLYIGAIVTHVTARVMGMRYQWYQEFLAFTIMGEMGVTALLVWSLCERLEYGRRNIY